MAKQLDDTGIHPAGDQPPAQGHADKGGADPAAATGGQTGDQGKGGGEDYETRYKNLEKKFGEQGNEMGALKQQNQQLMQQLQQMQQTDQGKVGEDQQAPDYQARISEIYKAMDAGDLSIEEALQQSNALTAEMVQANAEAGAKKTVQEILQQKDAEQVTNRFYQDNPDFIQLRDSGALEEVKGELPGLHDDFSAYFALKSRQVEQEAYERGKQEINQLAEGDRGTEKVLTKPGSSIRNQNSQPLTSESDIKKSMAERLAALRGGG